jgi:hypothetical protein
VVWVDAGRVGAGVVSRLTAERRAMLHLK